MVWTPRTTVAAIIERERRFLMVEEHVDQGAPVFNQPAGHLEEEESLVAAVIRETREETGQDFTPAGIVGIYRWRVPPGGNTYLRFCFYGQCQEPQAPRTLDPDILSTHWLTRQQLVARKDSLRSPLVLRCIDDYMQGIHYPLALLRELV